MLLLVVVVVVFVGLAEAFVIQRGALIPPNVTCKEVQWCDKYNICSTVCAPGSVELSTWLVNAVNLQNKLARKQPLCYAQLLGTHNSGITLANGYGNEDHFFQQFLKEIPDMPSWAFIRTNNQYFSLTDQLRMGIRMLELDTHYFLKELHIAHCGGFHVPLFDKFIEDLNKIVNKFGYNITWDTETVGCDPSLSSIPPDEQRTLDSAFQEIAQWMRQNPDEFVLMFFDDQMDLKEWGVVGELLQLISKNFQDIGIFTPADQQKMGWPKLEDLVSMKKRAMFLSGADYGTEMEPLVFAKYRQVCNWQEPGVEDFSAFFPKCTFDTYRTDAGVYVRIETDQLQYGPLDGGFSWGLPKHWLNESNLPEVIRCDVNSPSPDLMTPTRVESQIWTWAKGQPSSSSGCASLQATDGRWYTQSCQSKLPVACLSKTTWILGAASTSPPPSTACPAGYTFASPITAYQNTALQVLLQQKSINSVWINMSPAGDFLVPY